MFQSLKNSIVSHNLLAARDETVRTARAAFEKITRDLQLAYLTPNRTMVDCYQTVFGGRDEEPSKLFFATLNHQRLYLDSRECDQTEITVGPSRRRKAGNGYISVPPGSPADRPVSGRAGRDLAAGLQRPHLPDPVPRPGARGSGRPWDTRSSRPRTGCRGRSRSAWC